MKMLISTIVMLGAILPASSQPTTAPSAAQSAIDDIAAELHGTLKEITALDAADKKLAASDKVQADTTAMLDHAESKIMNEEVPPLKERGRLADQERQRILDSGCPEGGGMMAAELADRCNPPIRAHKEIVRKLESDMAEAKARLAKIENTRRAVTETTLSNWQQHKANNSRRDQLEATKRQLYGRSIMRALSDAKNKARADSACKSLDNEKASCCLQVAWDNADPARCNIELVYQVFERAGVFATREIKATTR